MPRLVVRLDCSAETALAVCQRCRWRAGPTTRETARVLADRHRDAVHPGAAASRAARCDPAGTL